jgi:tetratricopeptide (TPR) repeat protein
MMRRPSSAIAGLVVAVALCATACSGPRKLLKQAEAYMEAERYSAAVRTYDRVLEKRPGEPRALVGMARAWLETNQPEQALTPARVAAETQVPGGQEVLIDAMIANGQGRESVDRAETVAKAGGGAVAWRRVAEARLAAGDLKGAVAASEKSLEKGGGSGAQSFAAWTHARTGNCGRATSLASRAVTGAPDVVEVQAEAGAVFRHCNDGPAAQAAASTARALLSRGPFEEEKNAIRRQKGGDLEGAIRRISWLRTIYPEEGGYARKLGMLWADVQVWGRAEVELMAALKLPPYAVSQGGAGVQFADRRAEQLTPQQRADAVANLWTELAKARQARGNVGGTAEALEFRARTSNSKNAEDWLRAARAWAMSPEPEKGIEAALRAVDLAPDSYEARKISTVVLVRAGMADRAIGHGRHAWDIKPGDPELAYLLARMHMERGEYRDARAMVSAGLGSAPGDMRLRELLRRLNQGP